MKRKLSILFFSTAVEHRTFRKTVRLLRDNGCDTGYIGFTRQNYPPSQDGLSELVLGRLNQGNYMRRAWRVLRQLPLLRNKFRAFDIVYCFSLDALLSALLASLFVPTTFVYQVQDIRPILNDEGLRGRVARWIERRCLRKVSHVVISSNAFYEYHFKSRYNLPRTMFTVIENKLEVDPGPFSLRVSDRRLGRKVLRIGYFGMLRCQRSWEILTRATQMGAGSIELIVRGKPVGLPTFHDDVASNSRICYGGPYADPDELESMYQPIDLVWAAYPYGLGRGGNWQWARTVRFYEAGAFGRPMIVQNGTQDAIDVENRQIGLVVDMSDADLAAKKLSKISPTDIELWAKNLQRTPRTLFVHTGEHLSLRFRLESCLADDNR